MLTFSKFRSFLRKALVTEIIRSIQARTGPAGYREIPGGPVGLWAGDPVGRSAGEPVASKTIMI